MEMTLPLFAYKYETPLVNESPSNLCLGHGLSNNKSRLSSGSTIKVTLPLNKVAALLYKPTLLLYKSHHYTYNHEPSYEHKSLVISLLL